MKDLDKTLNDLLALPPVKWHDTLSKFNESDRLELSRALSAWSERCAFLSEYAETLDRGHAGAVKKARSLTVKVRRALGYSYPKSGFATLSF